MATLSDDTARVFEPGAPAPSERLRALKRLRDEGFIAGIAFMPILPFISDSELEEMVKKAKEIDASYVFFAPLTLHGEGKQLYMRVVQKRFPGLLAKYEQLYRGRSQPPRQYRISLYKRALELCRRYGVRLGIVGRIPPG